MNKKRLLRVAEILEEHAAARKKGFNMNMWIELMKEPDGVIRGEVDLRSSKKILRECGYTACAVGEACLDPKLRAQGLRFEIDDDGYGWPAYDGFEASDAVEMFFNLSDLEGAYLFLPEHYEEKEWRSRKAVANRIREFVKHGGIPKQEEQLDLWNQPA